jgi:formylglycine-generating enzyme required for sulfatase activity
MSATLKDSWTIQLSPGVAMSFRHLPGGRFRMGARGYDQDEEPVHEVALRDFYLAVFPVTQRQFAVWTAAVGITHKNYFSGAQYGEHPAERMSWFEARDYCAWLTECFGDQVPVGMAAGLPTESQWEYASRLMQDERGQVRLSETEYYTGDGIAALKQAGWFSQNSGGSTRPVGQLQGTDFGLYDLHGNVDEWCRDAYSADAYKQRGAVVSDPCVTAAEIGESEDSARRVFRGGSWGNSAWVCRSAYRGGGRPDDRHRFQGFRVCLFSGPVPGQSVSTAAESECGSAAGALRLGRAEAEDRHEDAAAVDLSAAHIGGH